MDDVNDLQAVLDAHVPIIVLETHDEPRALELLTRVAIKRQNGLYCWSITEGLQRFGFGDEVGDAPLQTPTDMLKQIKRSKDAAIYALCDFHPYLINQPEHVRLLKDIALRHAQTRHTLVLVSHALSIPPELQRFCARFSLAMPNDAQLMAILREEVAAYTKERGARVSTDPVVLKKLARNLRGLTAQEARRLVRGAVRDDGAITESDLPEVNRAKFELLDMHGILSFEYDTQKFSAVGGLSRLRQWVQTREHVFASRDDQAGDRPRGVMLLGVQGGGKSLAARAIAGLWSVPLLRFDLAALYNKYIGETEKNLRQALQQAQLLAPCVLWIDEIEKGLAVGDNDDGTSRRVLGTLLTWMAEHRNACFVVATANDVSQLPPELLRKGRFDEIFFVDLPSAAVREEIFRIHLAKRNFDPQRFDCAQLAAQSSGFSGAEIEQAVVAAIYGCSAQRVPLTNEHILQQMAQTYPLSVTMAEQVSALRRWAADRTVSAD